MAVRHQGKLMHPRRQRRTDRRKAGKGGRGAESKAGEEGSEEKKRAAGRTAEETRAEWRRQDKDADRVI